MTGLRKYRLGLPMMTIAEAQAITEAHARGVPVRALELQEACRVMHKRHKGYDPRVSLPQLSPAERNRVNGVLLYRLGLAIGRVEGRKVA